MENLIKSIDPGSPLEGKARIGDNLISINGKRVVDVLDYKFYAYDRRLDVLLRRPDGSEYHVEVHKSEGGDLGLDFESYLMDSPRSCANNCVFCFIDQLPPGMRPTMYFKDDDARLSFLLGNYITLTNLSKREIQRIMDLHISPVNVSVHTTNPELRARMLCNPRAGETIEIMRRFAAHGIVMNCQIVCCPGWNDGEALQYTMEELAALYPGGKSVSIVPLGVTKYREGLERTMRELAEMYPAVHSVSVVPVGLTKYREKLAKLEPFTPEHAGETLDQVTAFGDACVERYGTRIFWCGDEMYLKAGRPIPPDEFYEEYTQLENGVGMLRLLETEFRSALRMSDAPDGVPFSIACGTSVGPFFTRLIEMAKAQWPALDGRVYPILNDFFGHSINVSGLITGQDLIAQLKGRDLGKRLFISQNMLRRQEMDFLDDVTLEQASAALGLPIYPTESDGFALWDAISGEQLPEVKLPERGEKTEYYQYNQN